MMPDAVMALATSCACIYAITAIVPMIIKATVWPLVIFSLFACRQYQGGDAVASIPLHTLAQGQP